MRLGHHEAIVTVEGVAVSTVGECIGADANIEVGCTSLFQPCFLWPASALGRTDGRPEVDVEFSYVKRSRAAPIARRAAQN